MRFLDRPDAGRLLAQQLEQYSGKDDVIVLGIPRGGVPVAFEVARHLNAPLDICLVRKLRVPEASELAMGAIASGGILVLNEEVVRGLAIDQEVIDAAVRAERIELGRREKYLRGSLSTLSVSGQQVIVVDDGLATGASMRAAIQALRRMKPSRIVVGVPVAPASTCNELSNYADELVCLFQPEEFHSVGEFYEDFPEISDEQVRRLLQMAHQTGERLSA